MTNINTQQLTKRIVNSLFYQLTNGCNNFHCTNEACRSCPTFAFPELKDRTALANKAVEFAPHYKQHMCDGIPPSFMKPELYQISKDFTDLIEKLGTNETNDFDQEIAKKIIENAFSSPEQLEYLLVSNTYTITKDNLAIDDYLLEQTSDCLYSHSELFLKLKKKYLIF